MLKAPFLFDVMFVVEAIHTIECSLDKSWLLSVLVIRWTVFHVDVHSCHIAWPLSLVMTLWLISHADAYSYPVAWLLTLVMIQCSLVHAFAVGIAASVPRSEQHV